MTNSLSSRYRQDICSIVALKDFEPSDPYVYTIRSLHLYAQTSFSLKVYEITKFRFTPLEVYEKVLQTE